MLQATVQGSFPFKGVKRRRGDILTAEDLDGVSRTVLDALVAQKLIVLSEEGGGGGGDAEAVQRLQAQVDRLRDDLAGARQEISELKTTLQPAVEAAISPFKAKVAKLLEELGEPAEADAPQSEPARRRRAKEA